jgi:glycosyltransferase involved in cell wall biosynthesis
VNNLTVLLVSLNHEAFIGQAMRSIASAFDGSVPLVHVDAGSTDGTVAVSRRAESEIANPVRRVTGHFATMESLLAADSEIETEYVCLLSADDFLHRDYGRSVSRILAGVKQPTCLNFRLQVCDVDGRPRGVTAPRWSGSDWVNRRMLCYTNPGRAPGSVVPWGVLRENGVMERHRETIVEDYVLWVELSRLAHLRAVPESLVFYRQHGNTTTSRAPDKRVAWSMGYGAGVARAEIVTAIDFPSHRRLLRQWRERIPLSLHADFDAGYERGAASGAKA